MILSSVSGLRIETLAWVLPCHLPPADRSRSTRRYPRLAASSVRLTSRLKRSSSSPIARFGGAALWAVGEGSVTYGFLRERVFFEQLRRPSDRGSQVGLPEISPSNSARCCRSWRSN